MMNTESLQYLKNCAPRTSEGRRQRLPSGWALALTPEFPQSNYFFNSVSDTAFSQNLALGKKDSTAKKKSVNVISLIQEDEVFNKRCVWIY